MSGKAFGPWYMINQEKIIDFFDDKGSRDTRYTIQMYKLFARGVLEADYRKDTPLQYTLDGATVAQCIAFGLFGIDSRFDGSIRVFPQPPTFAPQVRLRGLKLRGHLLDIEVDGERYRVLAGDKTLEARVGQSVIVAPDGTLRLGTPEEDRTTDASCSVG